MHVSQAPIFAQKRYIKCAPELGVITHNEVSVLATILVGVTVFVLGQFIVKLILDPIVAYKESLGLISAFFLKNLAQITNIQADQELQSELRALISTLLSKKEAIPQYQKISKFLGLPKEDDLINGCHSLNQIAYEMVKETSRGNSSINILMELPKVGKLLRIRLNYSEL